MRWRTFCVLSAGGSHAARAAVSIRMSVASIVTRHERTRWSLETRRVQGWALNMLVLRHSGCKAGLRTRLRRGGCFNHAGR